MTIKEKLLSELECAINAVYGDTADNEYTTDQVGAGDIDAIAHKVKFYMDL